MAITIQPQLERRLRQRAATAGIPVEAWLERVATDDEDAEVAISELDALAMEAIESGEKMAPFEFARAIS